MTQICTGLFTNVASTPFFLPLEQHVSEFRLKNLTQSNITVGSVAGVTTGTRIVEAFWSPYMNQGTAQVGVVGTYSGNAAPLSWGGLPQQGISLFNAAKPPISAAKAIQSFTPGTTTSWGATAHGFLVGDIVRVYGLTSAPQFGGLAMTVTAVSTNAFTTLLDSTGATTSVGFAVKIGSSYLPPRSLYYPEVRAIAKITNANPMVITTLVQQNYAVGDVVTFDIPSAFGMPQLRNSISGLPFQATVVAVNNAVGTQTVSVNVDSTAFGVFATNSGSGSNPGHWPLATSYPFGFPFLVPQGEGNLNNLQAYGVLPAPLPYANQDVLSFARQNLGQNGILIGAGDGTSANATGGVIGSTIDVWEWRAITSNQEFPFTPYP